MVETITPAEVRSEIEALHQIAAVVIVEHTDHEGLCAVCGCAFPCTQAVLAEHNLALTRP